MTSPALEYCPMLKLLALALLLTACGSNPDAPVPDGCTTGLGKCPAGNLAPVTCKNASTAEVLYSLPPTASACVETKTGDVSTWCCAPTPAVIDDSPNCKTELSPSSSACPAELAQVVTCMQVEAQPREACKHPESGDALVWCCPLP